MFLNFKTSAALGAALLLACSAAPAYAMHAVNDSSPILAGVAPAGLITAGEQSTVRTGVQSASAKRNANRNASVRSQKRDQARHQKMKEVMDAGSTDMKTGVLYAALPGSVLALTDSMLENAMGPGLRLREPIDSGVWTSMNWGIAKPDVTNTLRSSVGTLSNTARLERSLFNLQVGTPIYTGDSTRIDATVGLGSSTTKISESARKPELRSVVGNLGLVLEHRTHIGLDLRLGTQISGGSSELKAPGQGAYQKGFKQKFKHQGLGLRAEAGWAMSVGSGLTITPLVGMSGNIVRVKQTKAKTEQHTGGSMWAATRVAYLHDMDSGRTSSFWVQPTYIKGLKNKTTFDGKLAGLNYDISSRLPGDKLGARVGASISIGKQGLLDIGYSRFWSAGKAKQAEASLTLGYVHRL